mgnify:CR=1 FL=1
MNYLQLFRFVWHGEDHGRFYILGVPYSIISKMSVMHVEKNAQKLKKWSKTKSPKHRQQEFLIEVYFNECIISSTDFLNCIFKTESCTSIEKVKCQIEQNSSLMPAFNLIKLMHDIKTFIYFQQQLLLHSLEKLYVTFLRSWNISYYQLIANLAIICWIGSLANLIKSWNTKNLHNYIY